MGGRLTTVDRLDGSAPLLLARLRAEGFELMVDGDRLRIRPADRVTAEIRNEVAKRKSELLAILSRSTTGCVHLRSGLTVPRPALELTLDLERRGFHQAVDRDGVYHIEPGSKLSERDRLLVSRWRRHLAAIVTYQVPEIA